jgi:hypothetical protein
MEGAETLARRVAKRLADIAAGVLEDTRLNSLGHDSREWEQVRGRYPMISSRLGGRDGLLLYGDRHEALSLLAKELSYLTAGALSETALFEDLLAVLQPAVERGIVDTESLQTGLELELSRRLANISDVTLLIPVEGLWLGAWDADKEAAIGPDLRIGEVTFKSSGYVDLIRLMSGSVRLGKEEEFKRVSAAAYTDVQAGDNGAMWEQGEWRVRLALDILRTALYRHKGAWGGALGLMSHSTLVSRYILLRGAGSDGPFRSSFSKTRALPLLVEDGHRRLLQEGGLADLGELFSPTCNEVLQRVRRSINWASDATLEKDVPQSFLKYAVALETLLQGTETAPIGEYLAERVAFLLATGAEQRIEIRDRVKRLYRHRNMIVHGSASQPPLKDFNEFEDIVAASIMAYSKRFRHVSKWRDVVAAFDQQKFS